MKKFTKNIYSVLLLGVFVLLPVISFSANYYAVTNGSWNASTTWATSCGGAGGAGTPGASDDAYICSGVTVNINIASQCNNLILQGGIINFSGNNTLTVNNDLTANNANTITGNSASRVLNVTGILAISSGASLNISGQTVNVTGNVQIDGTLTMSNTTGIKTFSSNLTLGSTGIINFTAGETITINGNLITNAGSSISGTTTGILNVTGNLQVLTGGTTTIGNQTLTVTGTTTLDGTLSLNNNTGVKTFSNTVTINSNGSWNSTSVTTTGNLIFQNGITHNGISFLGGACTFNTNNQNISGSAAISFASDVTISGGITVNNQNTSSITINGILSGANGNTWNNNSNSTLYYGNAVAPMTTTGTFTVMANNNTVVYNRNGDQNINGTTYYNLICSNGGTKTVTNTDIIISGDYSINASTTYDPAGRAFTVNGTTTISGTFNDNNANGINLFTKKITINSGGSWVSTFVTDQANMIFQNGITNNGTSFSAGSATFNSNSQTIDGSASYSFANSVVVTSIILTNNATVSMTNTAAGTLSGTGTWTQGSTGILNYSGSTITITTLNASASGNTVDYNSAAAQTVFNPASGQYFNITFSSSGTKTLSATTNIDGDLLISGTAVLSASTYDINISGNWNNSSTATDPFTEGTRTVTFDGSTAQAITNTGNANGTVFYNLVIDNSGTGILLNNSVTSTNITLTNGAFDLNNNMLTVNNTATTGISRTNGYIISEATDNTGKVKWNIAAITGAHVFPFGTTTGTYIPLTFDLTAGTVGNVTVSTYPTAADNTPLPTTPVNVTNVNNASGDNSANTVDRFWQIDKDGVSGTATITFNATAGEVGTITSLIAQSWDAVTGWNDPLPSQSNTATSATVPGVSLNPSTPWALSGNDSPLPVEMLHFNALIDNGKVLLSWATASETNNDFFTVEKSINAFDFETMTIISGAGNSNEQINYSTIDYEPYQGISYYRLKQTDFDGQFTYSDVVPVYYFFENNTSIVWYQDGSLLNLNIQSSYEGEGNIEIYDYSGRLVLNRQITLQNSSLQTIETSNFTAGVYILRILAGNEVKTSKIILR